MNRSHFLVLLLVLSLLAPPASAKTLGVPTGFTPVGEKCDAKSNLPLVIQNNRTGYVLVFVPGGAVDLGSPESDADAMPDETPVTRAFVAGFWIGQCEVTNAQFRLYRPSHRSGAFKAWSLDGDSQPVVQVSWEEAAGFSSWAGMRLPSEAEWEKACRGADRRCYAWGNAMPPGKATGNFADSAVLQIIRDIPLVPDYDDRHPGSAPVGSFPAGASPYGALDMTGNVAEWCQNGWDERTRRFIESVLTVDEQTARSHRMYRGGSYLCGPHDLRAAGHSSYPLDVRENDLGFRAALSPVEMP